MTSAVTAHLGRTRSRGLMNQADPPAALQKQIPILVGAGADLIRGNWIAVCPCVQLTIVDLLRDLSGSHRLPRATENFNYRVMQEHVVSRACLAYQSPTRSYLRSTSPEPVTISIARSSCSSRPEATPAAVAVTGTVGRIPTL